MLFKLHECFPGSRYIVCDTTAPPMAEGMAIEGADARVLTNEAAIHGARAAGELDEFPGTPHTGGEIFTVNCPVPVVAPNAFTG